MSENTYWESRKIRKLKRYNASRRASKRRHIYIAVILALIWGYALGTSTFNSPF